MPDNALCDQKYLTMLQLLSSAATCDAACFAAALPAMEPVHTGSENDQQVDVVATVDD